MTDQLLDAFRSAGQHQPPSTVDLDAAVRRARVLRARRRRVHAAATLTTTAAVVAGALALAGVLPGANGPAAPSGGTTLGVAGAPVHVKNTAIGDFPNITDYSQIHLPLYGYAPTYAQENLLHQAEDELTIRCIARFGITPTYPRLPLERGSSMRELEAPRYGLADLASAKANGYGPYADMEKGGTDAFKLAYQPSNFESEVAYNVKNNGTPADPSIRDEDGNPIPPLGCARQDDNELYGPTAAWWGESASTGDATSPSRTVSGTPAELLAKILAYPGSSYRSDAMAVEMMFEVAQEQAYNDPRRKQADALWSQCMAAKGYDYRSPSTVSNHFNSPVTARQIRTATDDVLCKQSTNYLGINAGIEAEYEDALIANHRGLLERFAKELKEVFASAQGILNGD